MNVVLSIAGSDNTGGAGIQADIKTCCAYKVYAATAITGVTAQNSRDVFGVEPVALSLLEAQIDSIFEVMTPEAVKTGMLPSPDIIKLTARKMKEYGVRNLVVDPVMVATNGGNLVKPGKDTLEAFKKHLMPLASVITPNLIEASEFTGADIGSMNPEEATRLIMDATSAKAVLLKGGHTDIADLSVDYLFDGKQITEFVSPRIETLNTHGTGCTLSSAIACGLAQGLTLVKSVESAKQFINRAISGAVNLHVMQGPGPLDFFV